MRPAPTDDIGRAVELVNTWDTLQPDPEQVPDVDWLRRFLRWIGLPYLADRVGERDLAEFRAVRSELRVAFDARTAASAIDALNAILASRPVVIRADVADPEGPGVGRRFRYEAASHGAIDTLVATCAVAVIETVESLGLARIGQCAGSPCTCVFVDRTRNRRRRFCSDQCNDRVAQVAHRRRAAAG